MLAQVTAKMDRARFESSVVSLTEAGPMAARIIAGGTHVEAAKMRPPGQRIAGFKRLRGLIRQYRPDVIQTWLYHADLIGTVAALGSSVPVVWNLRQSNLHPIRSKRGTRLVVAACARLSGLAPKAIVCGSQSAFDVHVSLGYARDKLIVIPNGVDLNRFRKNDLARAALRRELAIDQRCILLGHIARFDPQKDHASFVRAAAQIARTDENVHFVLCGPDVTEKNTELVDWIAATGFVERFHLLGPREDIEQIVAALDLSVSSSLFGEGFSNTLAESLACGVPCVTTDVGDSACIVRDCGAVVPPGDTDALAKATRAVLDRTLNDTSLSRKARLQAEERLGIDRIISRYEDLYEDLLARA